MRLSTIVWFVLSLLLLATLPAVLAQSLTLVSDTAVYSPGETVIVIANLPAAVQPLEKTQIELRNAAGTKMSIAPFFLEHTPQRFYIWFDIPSMPSGQYVLTIRDIPVVEDGRLTTKPLTLPLTIEPAQTALALHPPVLLLDRQRLTLTIENNANPTTVSFIAPPFLTHPYSVQEMVATTRAFTFTVDLAGELHDDALEIVTADSQYHVLLLMPAEAQLPMVPTIQPPPTVTDPLTDPFTIMSPSPTLSKTLFIDESLEGPFTLRNNGDAPLTVHVRVDDALAQTIAVTPTAIEIPPLGNASVTITINKNRNATTSTVSGAITFKESSGFSRELAVSITFKTRTGTPDARPPGQQDKPQYDAGSADTPLDDAWWATVNETTSQTSRKQPGKGTIALLLLMLVIAAIAYTLARKKEKQESFSQVMMRTERKR